MGGFSSKKISNPRVRLWRNTKVALTYIILIGLSCVFLIPFFWMLSTSFTEASKVIVKNRSWIPHPVVWKNYKDALTVLPFHLFLKNTLIITISCIIGQVVSASLVAFGFSRMRFRARCDLYLGTFDDDAASSGDADTNVYFVHPLAVD